ncbi:MAG: tetratricopeptide repeat protein, partial [Anaeromyxobacteraceae bacterium]
PAPPPPPPRPARKCDPLPALPPAAPQPRDRGPAGPALEVYGRVLETAPQNADALAGRGLCYLDLSQYQQATASLEAALSVNAQHGDALMGLAETFRYEGRRAEAVQYYERYLAAHPRGESASAARNAIEAMKE